MLASIVSDNQALAEKVRRILVDCHIDCALANVVSMDRALEVVARLERSPELIFVALSPEPDRALGVLEQLRKRTRSKLVAMGTARDPQEILRVVHAGSDDYLDEEADLEGQIKASLDRIESLVRGDRSNGTVITVMSSSGGTGRSMLSANLAFALAQLHGSCCLCDLDLRRGDLASMLNLKPRHSIIDLCANVQRLDQQMFDEALQKHDDGVHLLAAPQVLDDVQQVTSDGVEKVFHFARSSYPCVVTDLEDFFHREQFRALQMSDLILFTLRLDFTALRNARRTFDYLERAGIDQDKLQLVANQYGRQKELTRAQAEEALRMKTSHFIPDDPKTLIHSLNCGVPVVIGSPRSKLGKAIRKLAESVVAVGAE